MTPQENAEDLMNKMFGLDLEDLTKFDYIDHVAAKHFSLIAVDEILNVINKNDVDIWDIDILKYWREVKQEIENL